MLKRAGIQGTALASLGRLPFDNGSWTEGSMPEDHDP